MMVTPAHSHLAFALTKHYFGDTTGLVIKTLFEYDQASLRLLRMFLPNVKINELKRSLLILVKYQLVDYIKMVKNSTHQYEYSIVPNRVFAFFRIPRYIHGISRTPLGSLSASILTIVHERAVLSKEKLMQLMAPIQDVDDDKQNAKSLVVLEELIVMKHLVMTNQDLCINIEQLNRNYRDNIIAKTIYNYYHHEPTIKAICEAILELARENTSDDASLTSPVPLKDIERHLIPDKVSNAATVERYLKKLSTEYNNRFITSCGCHPEKGQMYAVDVGLSINYLVKEHLSSVITTRFGPKCCRVFRILLAKGPLLLKQVEELIMLPARDVREYSYMLIKEGFIRNRQVPKTPDNAPGKSLFIMSVDLYQVVSNVTDLCCRSISNLMSRYEFELHRNKTLLDRSIAVQELFKSSIKSESCTTDFQEDLNQYFNSHELSRIEWISRTTDKILSAKTQVDETLFLLHTWLTIYPNMSSENV